MELNHSLKVAFMVQTRMLPENTGAKLAPSLISIKNTAMSDRQYTLICLQYQLQGYTGPGRGNCVEALDKQAKVLRGKDEIMVCGMLKYERAVVVYATVKQQVFSIKCLTDQVITVFFMPHGRDVSSESLTQVTSEYGHMLDIRFLWPH